MATFVVLGNFTDQGAKSIRDMQSNLQKNRESGDKFGLKNAQFFMTQGHYDFVVVVEAPDGEAMLAQNLATAAFGNTRTETLRAYPMQEMGQILQRLG